MTPEASLFEGGVSWRPSKRHYQFSPQSGPSEIFQMWYAMVLKFCLLFVCPAVSVLLVISHFQQEPLGLCGPLSVFVERGWPAACSMPVSCRHRHPDPCTRQSTPFIPPSEHALKGLANPPIRLPVRLWSLSLAVLQLVGKLWSGFAPVSLPRWHVTAVPLRAVERYALPSDPAFIGFRPGNATQIFFFLPTMSSAPHNN